MKQHLLKKNCKVEFFKRMSSLRKETVYLYAIQISNLAIPLLTLPYLTKVLGLTGFGKLGLAQTVFFLMGFLIDFGFTYSASRHISLEKENLKKVNKIYTNVQLLRLIIYVIASLILIFYMNVLQISGQDKTTYVIALISSFSFLLIPSWLFNGLGVNSTLAIFTLSFRILTLIPIFLLVNNAKDYLLAFIIQNTSLLLLGGFISIYLRVKLNIWPRLNLTDKSYMKEMFKDGFDAFSGSALSVVYTTGVPFIVKHSLGDAFVGIYILVERILSVLKQLFMPIIQAYYSTICLMYSKNNILEIRKINRKIVGFYSLLIILALSFNYLFGRFLIEILFDNQQIIFPYIFISIIGQFVVALSIVTIYGNILPSGNGYILKRIYAKWALLFCVLTGIFWNLLNLGSIYILVIGVELLIVIEATLFIRKKLRMVVT